METMRESWTDERIDDLKGEVVEIGRRMDLGFAEIRTELRSEIGSVRSEIGSEIGSVRGEIGSVRGEVGSVRGEVNSLRDEIGSLRKEMNALFYSLQRTLIHFEGIMIVALIGLIATQL